MTGRQLARAGDDFRPVDGGLFTACVGGWGRLEMADLRYLIF
jgi:hypothetical protein